MHRLSQLSRHLASSEKRKGLPFEKNGLVIYLVTSASYYTPKIRVLGRVERIVWSLSEVICLYISQSSANMLLLEEILFGRSLMNIKKRRGPRAVAWGTLEETLRRLDSCPFKTVYCNSRSKKTAYQRYNLWVNDSNNVLKINGDVQHG